MADAALLEAEAPIMSVEDYLDFENASDAKHEFVNGAVYAMVGVRDRHNLIAGNLYAIIWNSLQRGCNVFVTDMKIHIRAGQEEYFYYPDVFVSCSPTDKAPYWREEPVLVAEVLSPSTARIDRNEKLAAYTAIPSLEEYLLISQDQIRVEFFRRRTGWQRQVLTEGDITLESVGLTLAIADLYRRTDLERS